ncbi:MAG: hypothetical protein H0V19_05605 [Euzebyales bacterium]|nr:hypothetical protein [Euzebyales bacterium]MBA3622488.1 hypothetical protein [Euzebyales bacterium]
MPIARPSPFTWHIAAVSLGGAAVLAVAARGGVVRLVDTGALAVVMAAAILIFELRPIRAAFADEVGEITLSLPFAFALLLSSGVDAAVVVLRAPRWRVTCCTGDPRGRRCSTSGSTCCR